MSSFSRVWKRFLGNNPGKKPGKSHKSRSLRIESLEDRALLSVTLGSTGTMVDTPVSNESGAPEAAAFTDAAAGADAAISPVPAQGSDADNQTITVAAASDVEPNLAAPRPKIVSADKYTVTIKWDRIPGAEWYDVWFSSPRTEGRFHFKESTKSCSITVTINSGPGVYQYAIKAHNRILTDSNEESDFGYTEKITLPALPPLETPKPFALPEDRGDQAAIMVCWEPDGKAASYTLEYKKSTEDELNWKTVTGLKDTYTIEGLDRESSYDIRVKAVAKSGSEYGDSAYSALITIDTTGHSWYLMDYNNYTDFRVDADGDYAYLYGSPKGGKQEMLGRVPLVEENRSITVYSDNTARDVTFTAGALRYLANDIVYVGGKTSNDTIRLEGTLFDDSFTMSQETLTAKVHTRDGESSVRQVVFETVDVTLKGVYGAVVKMSGVRSVTIDAGDGDDTFDFIKFGTTYDLIGSSNFSLGNTLSFASATSGVRVDMGKTKAQSVLSGQKGKIYLHGDIERIRGSKFNDTITTAANTRYVEGNGGSDSITLVGERSGKNITHTEVNLSGNSQRVKGKGDGEFYVTISDSSGSKTDGSRSTVNMSSVKSGLLDLDAHGDKIKVTGTKGDDTIRVYGDNANVRGNDGNDFIKIEGVNAKASGNKGNDILDLRNTDGKCVLDGGAGNDFLIAGWGNDVLKVSSGNNVLIGGRGADKITGGSGQDCLVANITGYMFYDALIDIWRADPGDIEDIVAALGKESHADGAKDTVKRGGGTDNYFYVNTSRLGSDFDVVDYKRDKGDILFDDLGTDIL